MSSISKELVNNERFPVQLIMDHESKNSHLRRAPIVQLDSPLELLLFLRERVPTEIDRTIPKITWELALASNVLHDEELEEADEGDDLTPTADAEGR